MASAVYGFTETEKMNGPRENDSIVNVVTK
jgi:hypothetical protein